MASRLAATTPGENRPMVPSIWAISALCLRIWRSSSAICLPISSRLARRPVMTGACSMPNMVGKRGPERRHVVVASAT